MKAFHCDHCDQLIFFENTQCVHCKRTLAYISDLGGVASLDAVGDGTMNGGTNGGTWTSPVPAAKGKTYKLCDNYATQQVCNWAIDANDPNALCQACRLTRTIPDLTVEGNKMAWYKLEVAKRRLLYTLRHLGLPTANKTEDPQNGLTFEFLADPTDPNAPRVLTGHAEGVITLNLDEADDAVREKRRNEMHEPYRTLLGHMRHEVGHYYWDVLIKPNPARLDAFRKLFGNDEENYADALQKHYQNGPPANWQDSFVSEYATTHAWEDWAETWAHYLHIVDTLETASDCGIQIRPSRQDEPAAKDMPDPVKDENVPFKKMMKAWGPLTYVLNSLNRGLGVPDAYPFVLSSPAIDKLKFVHDVVTEQATAK